MESTPEPLHIEQLCFPDPAQLLHSSSSLHCLADFPTSRCSAARPAVEEARSAPVAAESAYPRNARRGRRGDLRELAPGARPGVAEAMNAAIVMRSQVREVLTPLWLVDLEGEPDGLDLLQANRHHHMYVILQQHAARLHDANLWREEIWKYPVEEVLANQTAGFTDTRDQMNKSKHDLNKS